MVTTMTVPLQLKICFGQEINRNQVIQLKELFPGLK